MFCPDLTKAVVPSSVKILEEGIFYTCKSLDTVVLNEGLRVIGQACLYACPKLSQINLPSTLDSIGEHAFQYDKSLDTLIFPDNLRHIGAVSMDECENLRYCHLPEQLDTVTGWLLYGTAIESIVVPPHVTVVDKQAFAGCKKLRKVEMPASVLYLGDSLFIDGTHVDSLILGCATPPALGNGVFPSYDATLIVPCGAAEAYRQDPIWRNFEKIVENCTGIDEPKEEEFRVYSRDGRIVIDGAEGQTVQVFDVLGRQIVKCEILKSTSFEIPASKFATGAYVVRIGKENRKVIVR